MSKTYDPEIEGQYDKKSREKKKKRALDFLGGKCVECGTTENLQFHHKDKTQTQVNVSTLLTGSWEIILTELKKCELLCAECHRKHHHPTAGAYFKMEKNKWKAQTYYQGMEHHLGYYDTQEEALEAVRRFHAV